MSEKTIEEFDDKQNERKCINSEEKLSEHIKRLENPLAEGRNIAINIVGTIFKKNVIDSKKFINLIGGINPYWNQTECGYILEMYCTFPGYLYTPYGQIRLSGSGLGFKKDYVFETLKEILGLEIFLPQKKDDWGEHGPYYKITKYNEKMLPEPSLKKQKDYIKYEECKNLWND